MTPAARSLADGLEGGSRAPDGALALEGALRLGDGLGDDASLARSLTDGLGDGSRRLARSPLRGSGTGASVCPGFAPTAEFDPLPTLKIGPIDGREAPEVAIAKGE